VEGAEVDRLGPGFPQEGIVNRADNTGSGSGATVDHRRFVDGAEGAHGLEDRVGEARAVRGIEFVEVITGGFPILMNAERKVEGRLASQPSDVGTGFGGAKIEEVAVQVETGGVFAGADSETGGVQ